MNFKRIGLKAICTGVALLALAITACGDDSGSSSSNNTNDASALYQGDAAWYDNTNGILYYPNGIVTDVSGNIIGTIDLTTGNTVIGSLTAVVDVNTLQIVNPLELESVALSSSVVSLPTVLPSANSTPTATQTLYTAWKAGFIHSLADEKALYSELGAEFNEIFGTYISQGYAPMRVLWQTSTDSKCLIDEANGTNMYKRGCTVSEGIGYGMLISLFQGDMTTFDGLWIYSKAYRESPYSGGSGLMPWLVNTFSWTILDKSSATDADLDIAAALVIAYKTTGKQEYLTDALSLINALWTYEINESDALIYSGDTPMWHTADPAYNLSYFSPVALRLFAEVDASHDWKSILDGMYTYMQKVQAAGTGVFPDWSNTAGEAVDPSNGSATKTYWTFNKESVRIPWRIAWDYFWYKDERASAILTTLNNFIVEKSGGSPSSIPAVNYSWNLSAGDDITSSTLPIQWLGAWCATGMAGASSWLDECLYSFNAKASITASASSYFPDILQMLYSELMNGWIANP